MGSGATVESRVLSMEAGVYFHAFYNVVPANAPGNVFGKSIVGKIGSGQVQDYTLFDGNGIDVAIIEDGRAESVAGLCDISSVSLFALEEFTLLTTATVNPYLLAGLGLTAGIKALIQTETEGDFAVASGYVIHEHETEPYGEDQLRSKAFLYKDSEFCYEEEGTFEESWNFTNNEFQPTAENWYKWYISTTTYARLKGDSTYAGRSSAKMFVDIGDWKIVLTSVSLAAVNGYNEIKFDE